MIVVSYRSVDLWYRLAEKLTPSCLKIDSNNAVSYETKTPGFVYKNP